MNFIPLSFFSFSFFLVSIYTITIFKAIRGLKKIKNEVYLPGADIPIDVIIPYHNELDNLPDLMKSLEKQSYENYRIIWVNDHSTDGSEAYVRKNSIKESDIFIESQVRGKKAAISQGIAKSTGELIVFTDADCTHHPKWLESYANAFQQNGEGLYFGPVIYNTNSFIENIFGLDFLSLMGTGMGLAGSGNPVYMNGANYAISSDLIKTHDTKDGKKFASGDDVFVMHQIKKTVGSASINALNNIEILVKTSAPKTLSQFLKQRIRWGGKTAGYKDLPTLALAILVFGISILQIASLFLFSFSFGVISVWIAKIFLDLLALIKYAKVWTQPQFALSFIFLVPLYPFYIVSTALIGLFSNKRKWR
jgi:biofilm PGA synthesis N-glycosyltransferase PgaC